MSDDQAARNAADTRFLIKRMLAFALDPDRSRDSDAVADVSRRAVLDLLRTRTPGPRTLAMVAGELEQLWWPQTRKQQRQSRDRVRLQFADEPINHLADDYRKSGAATPRTRAEQDAAEALGLSVEGLRKARYRKRRTRKI
jgi:hypothetical protein